MAANIHPNFYKWLKAPTIEQIDAVIKKAGVTQSQFERYYGIYPRAIAHVRCGASDLPAKYWHLFFEEPKKKVSDPVRYTKKIDRQPPQKVRKKRTVKLSHLVG